MKNFQNVKICDTELTAKHIQKELIKRDVVFIIILLTGCLNDSHSFCLTTMYFFRNTSIQKIADGGKINIFSLIQTSLTQTNK